MESQQQQSPSLHRRRRNIHDAAAAVVLLQMRLPNERLHKHSCQNEHAQAADYTCTPSVTHMQVRSGLDSFPPPPNNDEPHLSRENEKPFNSLHPGHLIPPTHTTSQPGVSHSHSLGHRISSLNSPAQSFPSAHSHRTPYAQLNVSSHCM